MILMIDNYDSFTYNLVQYFSELGKQVQVYRNDKISLAEIEQLAPAAIVISPGPCTPNEAGISMEVIRHFAGRIPMLGVCLGHQAIGQVFGGKVVRADRQMHGKTSAITHDGQTIFRNIPSPCTVARYHSLILQADDFPADLTVTAWTEEGEVMALRHKHYPIEGVQFHPESIITEHGKQLLQNFLDAYITTTTT